MQIKNDPPAPSQNVNLYLNQMSQPARIQPVKTAEAESTDKGTPLPQDKVTLSQKAADIGKLKEAVAGVPEIREDKVAAIKAAITNGTYKVSGKQIAEKMTKESAIDMMV